MTLSTRRLFTAAVLAVSVATTAAFAQPTTTSAAEPTTAPTTAPVTEPTTAPTSAPAAELTPSPSTAPTTSPVEQLLTSGASADTPCQARFSLRDPKAGRGGYDKFVQSPTGSCLGILKSDNALASDPINGDLMWLESTPAIRIGGVPRTVVATEDGALVVYVKGAAVVLQSWDTEAKELLTCGKPFKVEDLAKNIVAFEAGPDFIRVKEQDSTLAYTAKCDSKGREQVYLPLTEADRKTLERFRSGDQSNNLTDPRVNQTFDEMLGMDSVIDDLIGNLRSATKRSTLVSGPPGIGKTSAVYQLARRIVQGKVPEWLKDYSIYSIDLSKFNEEGVKGKSQQKMTELIDAAAGKKVILLFDEIHQLIGVGASDEGGSDVTEVLKTTLANGRLAIIGTLTDAPNELALMRTKAAFFSRFAKIALKEPADDILMKIYKGKAIKLTKLHGVVFDDDDIAAVIKLTRQYIPNEFHPRIGLSVIEGLAAKLSAKRNGEELHQVTLAEIRNEIGVYGNVQALITEQGRGDNGAPMSFQQKVRGFKEGIRLAYQGNPLAVDTVYRSLVTFAAGNSDLTAGPAGVFLFVGPSGVGKTYLAETTANYFGMKYEEFPMSQYDNAASIWTLLGSAPGYVNSNPAGGVLTQFINQNPTSVINFDEVDKADPKILEALMNFIDTGKIKDSMNVKAEFKNGLVFMTSNFGLEMIDAYDKHVLGIKDPLEDPRNPKKYDFPIPQNEEALKAAILEELKRDKKLGTYMAGRIGMNRIVIFHHLDGAQSRVIAKSEVNKALKKLNERYKVKVDESVIEFIIANGFSFDHGARNARGLVRDLIHFPVSEKLLELDGKPFDHLLITTTEVDGKPVPVVEVR